MLEWIDTTRPVAQPTYRDLRLALTDDAAMTATSGFANVWLDICAPTGGANPEKPSDDDTRRMLEALIPRTQEALAAMVLMLEEIIRSAPSGEDATP